MQSEAKQSDAFRKRRKDLAIAAGACATCALTVATIMTHKHALAEQRVAFQAAVIVIVLSGALIADAGEEHSSELMRFGCGLLRWLLVAMSFVAVLISMLMLTK